MQSAILLALSLAASAPAEQRYDGVITKVDVTRGHLLMALLGGKATRAFSFDNSTVVMAGTQHVSLQSLKLGDHLAVWGTEKRGVGNWANRIDITEEKPGSVVAEGKPREFTGVIEALDLAKGTFKLANNSSWVMNAETQVHDHSGKIIARNSLRVGETVRVFVKDAQLTNIWIDKQK